MKFITFQPKFVMNKLKKGDYNYSKHIQDMIEYPNNANKIYATSLEGDLKEVLIDILLSSPSFPQTMIIFESLEYQEYDLIDWISSGVFKSSKTYKVYLLDSIKKDSIIHLHKITNSTIDYAQDDYFNFISTNTFRELTGIVKPIFTGLDSFKNYTQVEEFLMLIGMLIPFNGLTLSSYKRIRYLTQVNMIQD